MVVESSSLCFKARLKTSWMSSLSSLRLSVCDHWPVSVAVAPVSFSSSLCVDLLAASFLCPTVSLWVSDWIAA